MTENTNANYTPLPVQKLEKKEGRPTKLDEPTVKILEAALQRGVSIQTACVHAKIARRTYYYWLENDEDFLHRMEAAKILVSIKASNNISEAILDHTKVGVSKNKSLELSQWWLEKKESSEFGRGLVAIQNNAIVNNNTYVKTTPDEISRRFDELFGGAEVISSDEPTESTPNQ